MSLTKQGIHDSERCEDVDGQPCEMCRWADEVEKRHAAEIEATGEIGAFFPFEDRECVPHEELNAS